MKKFEWGTVVKDKVTGMVGKITGYSSYMTGCDQYLVQPNIDKEGKFVDGRWFDVNRLETIEKTTTKINTEKDKGADSIAPIK